MHIPITKKLYEYRVYVSAGVGASIYDASCYDTIFYDKELSHDFASWVSGDSMEPKYQNGSVALIRETGFDYDGMVYAVICNNQTYIKKVYRKESGLRLVSFNPKYYEKLIEIKDDSTSKNTSKTETSSSTKPSSSSSSSTQATVSESAQSDTKTVAGSTPKTPAQQDSGVPESSNDIMLNPEYHSHIDENGYNSLLGANVLDNNNGGNNSNASTESSSMGSSE